MQTRLKSLQRIALVYTAAKHAQAMSLEHAAAALLEAESLIDEQKAQARRSSLEGKAALHAGDHIDWQMHESQKSFTEWNADGLAELRQKREERLLEATEVYQANRLQLEQMESVLRELRSKLDLETARREQRESDDRFLSRQWWDARGGTVIDSAGEEDGRRMKGG